MNDHYEKVFDAITFVEHNKKDKTIIEKMHGDGGHGHEVVQFSSPVRAVGTYRCISAFMNHVTSSLLNNFFTHWYLHSRFAITDSISISTLCLIVRTRYMWASITVCDFFMKHFYSSHFFIYLLTHSLTHSFLLILTHYPFSVRQATLRTGCVTYWRKCNWPWRT